MFQLMFQPITSKVGEGICLLDSFLLFFYIAGGEGS